MIRHKSTLTTPIAILTDFGTQDTYVAEMKAILLQAHRTQLIDLTHQVPAFDIEFGAFQLWRSYRYFPNGTYFLAVVDPGVGSERRAIHVKSHHFHFVGPDNGLLSWAVRDIEKEEGTSKYFEIPSQKSILSPFHGRDLFAPYLRDLILGKRPKANKVLTISGSSFPVISGSGRTRLGSVLLSDHYGNLITNLAVALEISAVEVGKHRLEPHLNYASISAGEAALVRGSHGMWEIAAKEASAVSMLRAKKGDPVKAFLL